MSAGLSQQAVVRRGGPLAGVRVIELSKVWAGPFTGKMLAFLGAEVIRVESRSALDTSRGYNSGDIDLAPGHQAVNPQKLSVQINTRKPEGRELLLKLVATADVFIENLRPGAIARAGLDYEALRAVKPDLVYLSMGMYGNEGPLAYQSGYAPCFAALAGLTAIAGYEGEIPTGMNIRYGDSTSGVTGAFAVAAAMLHRKRTGEGQFIDLSTVEALSSIIGDTIMDYAVNGAAPRCDGNRHAEMAPHGAYPCANGGWIAIAGQSDAAWASLARMIGGDALAGDARFATLAARQANLEALDALVSAWTGGQDAALLQGELQAAGIAAAKSLNTIDLVADPELWASGFFPSVTDCSGEARSIIGPAWIMSRPAALNRGAPALGEDNAYVLGEILELSAEDQERLAQDGVTV